MDIQDTARVSGHFGQRGSLSSNLTGAAVYFSTGDTIFPDTSGYISLPPPGPDLWGLSVFRNGQAIGALITFWGH